MSVVSAFWERLLKPLKYVGLIVGGIILTVILLFLGWLIGALT